MDSDDAKTGDATDVSPPGREGSAVALPWDEREWRRLIESAQEGISALDASFRFTFVNRRLAAMLGYAVEEMIGRPVSDFVDPEELADNERLLERRRQGRTDVFERRFRTRDGRQLWFLVSATPVLDANGAFAGSFATCVDISERKRSEEVLRQSERRFRSLIENMRDVYARYDLDLRFRYISPAIRQLVGRDPEWFVGKTHTEAGFAVELAQRFDEALRAVIEAREARAVEFSGEFLPGKRFFESRACPEFDENGAVVSVVTVTQDITERRQAETERERLQTALAQSQKTESVGRLAGGVAHDFNNMLSVILAHTEMALEQVTPGSQLFGDLQEVRQAAERSADLTRQLLAFARKQTVAPMVLDLNETVGGMLKMLRRLIGEDIDLAWVPFEGVWSVRMDPTQIDQILTNLCVNARDAIAGVGKVTIETANVTFDLTYCSDHPEATPGEYVLLAVSDDGCGMDRVTLSRLFEPFFTTKELGKGTGLGLATTYGIVKQNLGFINVYSEPHKGTTFRIYLPRHGAAPRGAAEGAQTQAAAPVARGCETVLVVEDEPVILRVAASILRRQGYSVLAAATPGEAIRLAREHVGEIHLLVTDVVMPEMNGRDLARNLLPLYPALKRLFMSGYTANVIAHHGVLDEGVNFIQKPFSGKDFAAKVREVLDAG